MCEAVFVFDSQSQYGGSPDRETNSILCSAIGLGLRLRIDLRAGVSGGLEHPGDS